MLKSATQPGFSINWGVIRVFLFILISIMAIGVNDMLADARKFTIVIDAGHGGKDIGATDNGIMEKNINLKVAKQLESLIKKKMKDTNVVMTRTDDSYLTLQERADKANKAQGDIFISIHTNSVDKKKKNRSTLSGSSVYTLGLHKDENNLEVAMRENSVIELEKDFAQKYSGFDPQRDESYIIFEMAQKQNLSQSIKFAVHIQKELVKSGRQDRGIHQAGFWVLWATSMPSVLVELDFICNPESAKYMISDKGSKQLAESIFKAVQNYENTWKAPLKVTSNKELTDKYIENSEGNLEETYTKYQDTEIATARSRKLKSPTNAAQTQEKSFPLSSIKTSNTKANERRRRSLRSKELSLNKSYEKDDLVFPKLNDVKNEKRVEELLSAADLNTEKSKSKNKKEEKKREREEKKKQEKEAKNRREDAHNAKMNKLVTVYKIQVLSSTDLLTQDNLQFCGLSPITTYKENNLYKYYYGESTDRAAIETLLGDVKKKIPDAFIVSSRKTVQKK